MAIHWQVRFRSLRAETLYIANIYDESYNGAPVQLTGATETFVTDEDNDTDPFAPVRKQSGYLRICDTGKDKAGNVFNWRDMIPSDDIQRPVTLTDSDGTLYWAGFLQPQNFGVALYGNPQVIEFPLQCPISITEGIDINYTETGIHNFFYLIQQIVESIPLVCRPDTFRFQGGDNARMFLNTLIDWQNFQQSEDNHTTSRLSMYDCLEGLCRFWGWCVRVQGKTLYFYCPDDKYSMPGVFVATKTQLNNLAAGTPDGRIEQQTFTTGSISNIFADVNNVDMQLRGPKNVSVNANPNIAEDIIINPFDSLSETAMNEAGWNWGVNYDGTTIGVTNDVLSINRAGFIFTAVSGDASFNQIKKYEGTDRGYGQSINVLMIKTSGSSSGNAKASFETKYMHSFSNGFFMLHGETCRGADVYVDHESQYYAGNREMFMALGVGTSRPNAQWWNGREWQSAYTRFTVTIGNVKPDYFTRYWQSGSNAIDTNVIVTNNLYGYLYADFFGSYAGVYGDRSMPEYNNEKSFNLKDFQVEFLKNSVTVRTQYPNARWNEIERKKDNRSYEYKSYNGNRTREVYSEDNIFASDKDMKPAYGVIMNTNGSTVGSVIYSTSVERPELHRANRIANYWDSSRRMILPHILSNGSIGNSQLANDITPAHLLTIDGSTLYPLSISHDWSDDVVRLSLIET